MAGKRFPGSRCGPTPVRMIDRDGIRQRYEALQSFLDERGRRLWASAEAKAAGYGGIAAVAQVTGLAPSTIGRGLKDLADQSPLPPGRLRRPGAGRKPSVETDPQLRPALEDLIEAAEVDEDVRAGALEVLAYLTATRHIPREQTEAYLLRLYDTLQPQHESFVWSGWVLAVALLGLETLSGVVRQAFGRGLIESMVMDYDDFRRDLERTLADPERMAGFQHDLIGPLEDAIGELSGWYAFSDAG